MFAHPACKPVRVAKRDGDQAEIHNQRDEDVKTIPTVSIRIRSAVSNAGPAMSGMPSGTMPNSSPPPRSLRAKSHELAHGQAKQNQTARDLKICHRDSERGENNFAEKNKTDGNAETR